MRAVERKELLGLLKRYELEVTWMPDQINPHGELENILDGRDILEDNKGLLDMAELRHLAVVDERLKRHADLIPQLTGHSYRALRKKNTNPCSHWWWWTDAK